VLRDALKCQKTQAAMDPISVAVFIVGLLGTAAKLSSILTSVVKGAKIAPKLAQTALNGSSRYQHLHRSASEVLAGHADS